MEWISVEKELPKEGQSVLALYSGEICQATYCESGDFEPITLNYHGCGCCGGYADKCSHWMPLPNKPKD